MARARKKESVRKLWLRLMTFDLHARGQDCGTMSEVAMKRAVDYGVFLERLQHEDPVWGFTDSHRKQAAESVRHYFDRFRQTCIQSSKVTLGRVRRV
jgi:hypothetical protein